MLKMISMIRSGVRFLVILLCIAFFDTGNEGNAQPGKYRTFIIDASITDLTEFRNLVHAASRLKNYGKVQVNISTLADKSFYEIPPGGNPWNEYASNNPALFKFFPDPRIAPFVPVDFVLRNKKLLMEKAKILRENGMEAAFFANEPAFLPAAFFEAYPQCRGPRVDHPRRSRTPCFSPCLGVKEMQDMYANMMADLIKNAPEIKTYFFKTNDAGSGNCWSDWLYSGPNGPGQCRDKTTGQRIEDLFRSMKAGAEKAGGKLDIYLSHPQGSSNFSDAERVDIQNRLPENCYFGSTAEHEMASYGSDIGFMYPVKGICDVLSSLQDLASIDKQKPQTLFIHFSSFYDRGNESLDVEDLLLGFLADHFENTAADETVLQRLHGYSKALAGSAYAGCLDSAFISLQEAFEYKNANFGNLYGIYWDVSSRMINRPLVAAPQRLSKEEEAYFLPYIFNVSVEEARMDYLDIHGGRWTTSPAAIKSYVEMIRHVSARMESIDPASLKSNLIPKMALALRMHASLIRSCGNFAEAQQIRDSNAAKLNGPVHRPGKESTWTGDPDLLKFNAIMRDELDNTAELTQLLQHGGLGNLCLARDNAHEDCFLLNRDIIGQLKKKYKIMVDHWRDIEDYLTTPFK
jgi:hypothetical protein